jgi:alpha-amylase
MQGFHWNSASNADGPGNAPWYAVVDGKAKDIGKHFDTIWLPPPSKAAVEDKQGPHAQGYLPYSLFDLHSDYGTAEQLKGTLTHLKAAGVMSVADVVLNHVTPRAYVVNDGSTFKLDPGTDKFQNLTAADIVKESGGLGAPDTGQRFTLVADVDHTSAHAQQTYAQMLSLFRKTGYDGFRYDFAKGFEPATIARYNDGAKPEFSVAELWDDFHDATSHREQLRAYVEKTGYKTSVFDFTTKAVLQKAVESGDYSMLRDAQGHAAGLLGIAPAYAVTFVDNHDTGSSPGGNGKGGQRHWEFPGDRVMEGYAYILTHPGIPTVYWPHYYDWKSPNQGYDMKYELDKLLDARKAVGITATSPMRILAAEKDKYAAIISGTSGTLAMKIGSAEWQPPKADRWELVANGKDYVVWKQLPKEKRVK